MRVILRCPQTFGHRERGGCNLPKTRRSVKYLYIIVQMHVESFTIVTVHVKQSWSRRLWARFWHRRLAQDRGQSDGFEIKTKAPVTQITTRYICGDWKSISEHTSFWCVMWTWGLHLHGWRIADECKLPGLVSNGHFRIGQRWIPAVIMEGRRSPQIWSDSIPRSALVTAASPYRPMPSMVMTFTRGQHPAIGVGAVSLKERLSHGGSQGVATAEGFIYNEEKWTGRERDVLLYLTDRYTEK